MFVLQETLSLNRLELFIDYYINLGLLLFFMKKFLKEAFIFIDRILNIESLLSTLKL